MNNLIIGNNFCESVVGDVEKLSLPYRNTASVEAKRLAWFLNHQDALVIPGGISDLMLSYLSKVMGKSITRQNIISCIDAEGAPIIVSNKLLLSQNMGNILKTKNTNYSDCKLMAYYTNSAINTLACSLGIAFPQNATHQKLLQQSLNETLNSKAIFRMLFLRDLCLPHGVVCNTLEEFDFWLRRIISSTPSVIIKQPFNASGDGNICVSLESRDVYPGVFEAYTFKEVEDITDKFISTLWSKQTDGCGNDKLVLEEYLTQEATIFAEYEITDLGKYQLLIYGRVRMSASEDKHGKESVNWSGFEIPFCSEAPYKESFFKQCAVVLEKISRMGFVGRVNLDAIVVDKSKVYFNEINARLGGCSHVKVIADMLIGSDFLDSSSIVTRNKVSVNSLQKAIEIAESLNNPTQGIVILNEGLPDGRQMEYMVFAETQCRALKLEKIFNAKLIAANDMEVHPA